MPPRSRRWSSGTRCRAAANELLIEVKAAAVNPSDVKAATGLMPYAVFPRTPGRDYAGVVIDGPAGWIGREVFGSSGDLGIRRDGTHATHLAVEADAVVEKPKGLSWEEAAGIGVPFVTAMEGLRRAGMPKSGETVLVMGVNGKVGQAATQIATWHGARVIGVVRKNEPYEGHANSSVEMIDASATTSRRACANSPAARAPTSSSTPSAIPIFRPRTNRWRCADGRS